MLDRSANMMKLPRCMFCIPIDTATFVFGIFSSVLSGFGVVTLTLFRSWIASLTDDGFDEMLSNDPDTVDWDAMDQAKAISFLQTILTVMFLYVCCLISFIFSVFLCYGTHKKRPGFVKAYLVYGVVLTMLMMVGAIVYSWLMEDIVGGSIVLIICGVYSMLLLMVQRTHELIRAQQASTSAQLLCPEPCLKA